MRGAKAKEKRKEEKAQAEATTTKTLNVLERLLLRNIIPQMETWNFARMKEARELIESFFTDEEEKALQIKAEGQSVTWRNTDDEGSPIPQERDFEISENLVGKIATFLKRLDEQEKLNFGHYSLCDKFW